MGTDRFLCPSSDLSLRGLLRQGRKVLLAGLGVAAVVHLSLTQITGLREEEKATKPLTTKFVKRQPRLTKPLEMKKRPRPKRRQIQRKMVAVKARESHKQASTGIQPMQLVGKLSRPKVQVGRVVGLDAIDLEPEAMAQQIVGAREDKHVVDMSLEMVDINALDTGKHHAMVIQDPTDRRLIRGFFHLLLARPRSLSIFGGRGGGTSVWDDMKTSVGLIVEEMNRYTDIRTDVVGQITFDDSELFKVPWVMTPVPNPTVRVTPSEARNMGRYLMLGGFQLLENAWGVPGPVEGYEKATREVARETLEAIGLREGKEWAYEQLPGSHAIYHCYFDFDGPPPGKDMNCYHAASGRTFHDYLEGVTIDGRMWILFSQKGYSIGIHDFRLGGYYQGKGDAKRIVQFCINTIIFALTQEGSITNQVMDTVGY